MIWFSSVYKTDIRWNIAPPICGKKKKYYRVDSMTGLMRPSYISQENDIQQYRIRGPSEIQIPRILYLWYWVYHDKISERVVWHLVIWY